MDCNIRDIGSELMREMKIDAVRNGLTLRDWCISVFIEALAENAPTAQSLEPISVHPEVFESHIIPTKEVTKTALSKQYPAALSHDPTCKCFICKPPKEK